MVIIKIVCVFLVVFCAYFFDIKISVSLMGEVWSLPLWKFLALIFSVIYVCKLFRIFSDKLFSLLGLKTDVHKGVGYLQEAFSGMLMKDHKVVWKALNKAKKHLGEIPFISWLEGQLCLINGDVYKAKSLFFNLSSQEKGTALGAYSLAQLSLQNKSDKESIEAIKSILSVYPNAQDFLNQIVSLSIRTGDVDAAFHYLHKLSCENRQDVEAVAYFEKWKQSLDLSDLKRAHKLAPQISDIAIIYSDELLKNDEKRSAEKTLLRTFELSPTVEIFDKYVELGEDKIRRGEKLLKVAPQSWVPYYELSKLCISEDMFALAFDYISKAYELAHYSFISDELVKINAHQNNGGTSVDLSEAKPVKFFWRCSKCGESSLKWMPVCSCCMSVATYSYVEELEENLPATLQL